MTGGGVSAVWRQGRQCAAAAVAVRAICAGTHRGVDTSVKTGVVSGAVGVGPWVGVCVERAVGVVGPDMLMVLGVSVGVIGVIVVLIVVPGEQVAARRAAASAALLLGGGTCDHTS